MLRTLHSLVFYRHPAEFIEGEGRAVRPTRAAAPSSRFASLTQDGIDGRITSKKVILYRYTPFFGNSFKPYFVGHFEEVDGRVVLRGSFQMHWSVRVFLSIWLGSFLVFALLLVPAAITSPSEYGLGPLLLIAMFVAGLALVLFAHWLSRNDESILREAIGSAMANV